MLPQNAHKLTTVLNVLLYANSYDSDSYTSFFSTAIIRKLTGLLVGQIKTRGPSPVGLIDPTRDVLKISCLDSNHGFSRPPDLTRGSGRVRS